MLHWLRSGTHAGSLSRSHLPTLACSVLTWWLFALEALYLTAPAVMHLSSKFIGNGGDIPVNIWIIVWVKGWLEGRHSLYITHQILTPEGANLAWMTLDVPTSVVVAVVSNAVGLVAAYNLAVILSQVLNGALMYHLARRIGLGWFPGLVAGMTFMGSTHLVAESLGHLNLLQAYFILGFIIVLWHILASSTRTLLPYVSLGTIWALTFYAVEDYALYELAAALVIVLFHPAVHGVSKQRLVERSKGWAVAAAVGVAGTWPLWSMLVWGPLAPTVSSASQTAASPYVVDLFGLLIPAPWGIFWWLRPHWHLSMGVVEAAFPGFLTLVAVYAAARLNWPEPNRQRGVVRMAMVGTLAFGLLELGSYLHVDGAVTTIPLPYLLLAHVPGWGVTLPERLSLLTALFGSILVGAMVDRLCSMAIARHWSRLHQAALVAGGSLLFIASSSALPFPLSQVPRVPLVATLRADGGESLYVPAVVPGTIVGVGPTNYMYWEAIVGLPTPEGYVSRLPQTTVSRIDHNKVLAYLWGWQFARDPFAAFRGQAARRLSSYLRRQQIRSVIVLDSEVRSATLRVAWLSHVLGSSFRRVTIRGATVFLRR